VECFGVAEPTVEAEQVAMLIQLYGGLGVPSLSALVNSVGGSEDRPRYRAALLAYLEPRASELCPDCQRRLAILAGAPSVLDHLTDGSRARFDAACQALSDLGISFQIEPRLVRGLDYYTGLVFEIQSASPELGSQSALVGGGRYDELVAEMGGPPTPAVGFALGVERAILALPGSPESFLPRPDLFLAPLGEAARRRALVLAQSLRGAGLHVEVEHRAVGPKAQLKRADKLRTRTALVLGDAELASGRAKLRDMKAGSEREIALDDLAAELVATRVAG
jgi:histidyl-tRNA synthetase